MTSKKALNILEFGGVGYTVKTKEEALSVIEKDLGVLELFRRLYTDKGVWKDTDFGTGGKKLYIDGCIEYLSNEEKELFIFKNWLAEVEVNEEV